MMSDIEMVIYSLDYMLGYERAVRQGGIEDTEKLNAEEIEAVEKAIEELGYRRTKLAEYIEPFTGVGKFKCPSCGEMHDACYDEETGEAKLWFNYCPECGQSVITKANEEDANE
ncbi:MAG: hypothetical protein K0R00_3182 [Herbinix sp.]|jgi:predicted RNA-binding Zn-ribbon protein involved in translation (DUF1610 family)|nr:hypothetical protein [Herbinix sp.]